MNSQVLKPCPFCGSGNLSVEAYGMERDNEQPDDRSHAVGCEDCGCLGAEVAPISKAVEQWNTRATPAPIPDAAEGVNYALLHEYATSCGIDYNMLCGVVRRSVSALRDGGGVPSVQISGHLDEIDAPAWEFISAEARKLGPITGSIDNYNFSRPNGSQPNGGVTALWNGNRLHALAVTVRDGHNRTVCVRVLAPLSKMETTTKAAGVGE